MSSVRLVRAALTVVLASSFAGSAAAQGRDPFAAAQAGVDWIVPAVCSWMQSPANQETDCTTGQVETCLGCHVQGEATFALSRAASRCYTTPATACALPGDVSLFEFTTRFLAGTQRKACIIGPFACNGPRQDPNTKDGRFQNLGSIGLYPDCGAKRRNLDIPITQTVHAGLAFAGWAAQVSPGYDANLLALDDWLATQQQANGRWILDHAEPPVSQGDSFATGAAVIALAEGEPRGTLAQAASYRSAMDRAAAWVRTAALATNQDKVFGLLALVHSGVAAADPGLVALRQDLTDDQHPDGGWAERAGLGSNAYATGQALFALLEAGMTSSDAPACAGIDWLVRSQQPTGEWSMGVEGTTTDSSFGSEFTATSWPVLVLGSLRRFGVEIVEEPPLRTSCDGEVRWTMTVRNVADNPCGLFPREDALTLGVTNDSGDRVRVEPPALLLGVGDSTTVTVVWQRGAGGAGRTSTTRLVVSSDGASAVGCPVTAQRDLALRTPSPDVPFGVEVGPAAAPLLTCVDRTWWSVVVRNTAEVPCGSIPTSDVIELSATNDLGDVATVTPPSLRLRAGGADEVVLEWTRSGPVRPPGVVSTTTVVASSAGARAAGTPIEATLVREVATPAAVRRFGVLLAPEEAASLDCAASRDWVVTVTNTADDPCGTFPTSDTFELSAVNDSGDVAGVTPPSLTLASGESQDVTVSWRRVAVPAAPELPSTTTLVVTSVGARDAGLLVDAAGAYSQAVPRPAPPWALELDPPSAEVTTCGPVHDWTLRVRNVADDACGLFPAVDDISLAGTSDLGDGLVFTPPAVALGPGDEADVRVRWQRQGPPRDPGVTSSITITATSGGAAASGDVVIATSALRVVAPDDDVPGPLAPGLRVSRQGADVALAWAGSADVVGGYEVVAVTCDVRDACAELPAKNVLDARGPRATTAPGELATMFAGAAEAGQPALEFYKVRATSPCRGRPGSTCPFTCTDPRRCDGRCR